MKSLISIFVAVLFAFSANTFAQTVQTQAEQTAPQVSAQSAYTCELASNGDGRKICTDRSAYVYLKENFRIEVDPTAPAFNGVVCDWDKSITPGFFNGKWGKPCESTGRDERTVIGWVTNNLTTGDLLIQLGIYQVNTRNTSSGKLTCEFRNDYFIFVNGVKLGGKCTMTLNSSGEKLYFSYIEFNPNRQVKDRRYFVAVMNVDKITSQEDVTEKIDKIAKIVK